MFSYDSRFNMQSQYIQKKNVRLNSQGLGCAEKKDTTYSNINGFH